MAAGSRRPPSGPADGTPCRFTAVGKELAEAVVLSNVDLEVPNGSAVVLLGENGAGKTTLLALATGLRTPTTGRVTIFGNPPRDMRARSSFGVVLQDPDFPRDLNVGEILDLVARHRGGPTGSDLLEGLGLGALRGRRAGGLSGGQTQRLALACALIGRSPLLILDEPTSALDHGSTGYVADTLRTHVRAGGSLLMTTHSVNEAAAVADRLVLLHQGTVVDSGSPDAIADRIRLSAVTFRCDRSPTPPVPSPAEAVGSGSYRAEVGDADDFIRRLVASGIAFHDLTVHRLTLGEAVAQAFCLDDRGPA